MNVSLTPELERIVEGKVKEGLYSTASEVDREALRCLNERDEERLVKLDAIRQAVAVGLAQVDQGQGVPGPEAHIRSRVGHAKRGR